MKGNSQIYMVVIGHIRRDGVQELVSNIFASEIWWWVHITYFVSYYYIMWVSLSVSGRVDQFLWWLSVRAKEFKWQIHILILFILYYSIVIAFIFISFLFPCQMKIEINYNIIWKYKFKSWWKQVLISTKMIFYLFFIFLILMSWSWSRWRYQ